MNTQNLVLIVIFQIVILSSYVIFYLGKRRDKIRIAITKIIYNELTISIILFLSITFLEILRLCLHVENKKVLVYLLDIVQIFLVSVIVYLLSTHIINDSSTKDELHQLKLYNKTLSETNDSLRLLKHDYNNILQSINGYIITKQYEELDSHIKGLISNAKDLSNLECISPKVINQPAVFGVIGSKYFIAKNKNVKFNIEVFADISSISFDFTKLSRILGILLDNAIEAAEKAENPLVNVRFSYNEKQKLHIIEIKNTFEKGKKIDTTKIFEKGESSKAKKSGLGLWEVRKILSSCDNASICASINPNNNFVQTLFAQD